MKRRNNITKVRSILAWVLLVLIALGFAAAALGKLTGAATPMFANWGYPAWFATVIGCLEALGAVGLLIPSTARWAVYGLTVIMLGAAYTHLANNEVYDLIRPIIFTSFMWLVLYLRKKGMTASSGSDLASLSTTKSIYFKQSGHLD